MSFFYADIKTDELKVHGHTNSISGQIEILDAASTNMVILKAPDVLASNVTITLPTENGATNSILTATDGSGTLGFVTASGDLTLGSSGAFTVNGISNTSTIQSTANIVLAGTNSLYFADSNVGLRAPDNGNLAISATSNIILEKGSSQMVFDIGATNSYINFSNVVGETGYGIKSNNGVMQYKSISESWSNIGSDTLAGLTDVSLSSLANNNILVYNTSDSKWHNDAITSGYYGSFYDTSNQSNNVSANYNVMRLNSTDEAYGVSIQNNSQVVVAHSAVYNIQFSAQLDKTDSGTDIVNIWLLKNGTNVSNSDTELSLVGNAGKLVAAWNFLLSLATNDYIELAWQSNDPNLRLFAQSNIAFAPGIPSVILTVQQVAYTLGGSSGYFMDLFDVNTAGKTGNSLVQYNVSTSKWDAVSNLTLNNGNYIKLGTTGNISGSNGGNVTINGGNVDVIVSGEAHIHNNLRVTGNIFGSPNGGNLTISSGNVDIVTTGHLNILGNAHIPYSNSRLAFGDQTTYIQSPATGNLDIRATAGNVNITANHDVVITTNSASTIRLVGPNGSSPVNISFAGSCSYINFGATTGESGTGIKYNGTNVAVGSSGSWSGISNTTLNIAGRTVALGGSNTIGFTNLTGTATNSQLANSTITVGTSTLALGTTYAGLDLTNSTNYKTSNLVGTITNAQLAGSIDNSKLLNSSVTIGSSSVALGGTTTGTVPNYLSYIFPSVSQSLGVAALASGIVSNSTIYLTETLNDVTGWANNTYRINGLTNALYRIKGVMGFQRTSGADLSFWLELHEGSSSNVNSNPRYVSAQGSCYGTNAVSTTSFECIRDYRVTLPTYVHVVYGNQTADASQIVLLSCMLVCERIYNIY
jgi:hypothetical protein